MSKSKIEKRLPEPQYKKEQKADVTSVRPAIAKPHVIGSQSTSYDLEDVEKAKDFIWNYMSDLDKQAMIKMSSHTYIESPELRFYITAAVVKERIATY